MKRIAILLGIVVLLAVGCRGGAPPDPEPDPGPPPVEWSADMQSVADGNNRFALDLYGKLREEEKGNLFFSPYSIHTALGMTATGAKGTTRDQMVKVLHLPIDEQKALASGDLGRFYAHPRKDYELSVANALWGQKDFPWRAEWLSVQNERFGAGFNEADFERDPEGERQRINRWVEGQTHDKIKDLIPRGLIDKSFRMVLANAIYFKGQWEKQFDPKKTRDDTFTLSDGSKTMVPMMVREGGFRLYRKPGPAGRWEHEYQIAEIPYRGSELSMVVIVPGRHDGLPQLEKQLSADALNGWLAKAHDAKEIGLALPKFRLESPSSIELKPHLVALGMVDAFADGAADFTGMCESRLHIAFVRHKAFVNVNEEGTEAAAATAVGMRDVSGPPPPFRADRPFLFLIRDVKHGTILFMGRVMNPKG